MFINNINPVLLSIGPFEVRYYGLVYAIGFLIAYYILYRAIKNNKLHLKEEQLDRYFLWLIVGSIVISRLFEVLIYNAEYYFNNPAEMIAIWNGGLSYHGGILGAVIVTWIFAKKYKIKFYDIADIIVLPAIFMLAIGKLANYTNSELYGTITNTPWCVVFQQIDTYCRHPVQIYEFLIYISIFIVLLIINKYNNQKSTHKLYDGIIFWMFILLYGITRLIITFLRDEPTYLGLNVGQWVSIVLIGISSIFLIQLYKNKTKNI